MILYEYNKIYVAKLQIIIEIAIKKKEYIAYIFKIHTLKSRLATKTLHISQIINIFAAVNETIISIIAKRREP